MKRYGTFLLTAVLLVSLLAAGQAAVVRTNTYNNWAFQYDSSTSGLTLDQKTAILAKRDIAIITEFFPSDLVGKLRALNPNIQVYREYTNFCKPTWDKDTTTSLVYGMQYPLTRAEINANDWWLRDGNGNIVQQNSQSWYLDVGKPGFKEEYLKCLLAKLQGQGVDGVALDWWTPIVVSSLFKPKGLPVNPNYPTDQDWYDKAWKPFIGYVMPGLRAAGYRIIGNCAGEYKSGSYKLDYQRSLINATIYEQFAVNWPGSASPWLSPTTIAKRIYSYQNDPLVALVAEYGIRTSDTNFQQKRMLSLAMYYIATPMQQTNRAYNYYGTGGVFYDTLWSFDLGSPLQMAVKSSTKYFWSRKYGNGIVLFNYDPTSVSYALGRRYKDASGKIYYPGTVTLPSHTGLILKNY